MKVIGAKSIYRTKRLLERLPTNRVAEHFAEYSRSSSFHGIKYLTEKDRHFVEKVCWVVGLMFCFYLNWINVAEQWHKWKTSPMKVTFAHSSTPVWKVPFPAVTICNEIKSSPQKFNFSMYAAASNVSDDIQNKLGAVSLFCDDNIDCPGDDYVNDTTLDLLKEVAPPMDDFVYLCLWNNKLDKVLRFNCSHLFTRIVTAEGICYNFNLLDKRDLFQDQVISNFESEILDNRVNGWSPLTGYDKQRLNDVYPYRALHSGKPGSLVVFLVTNYSDVDPYCRNGAEGFKVILHHPADFPLVGDRYLRVPFNQEVLAVIQPKVMTTSEELLPYDPEMRHCYFPSERYLAFFKVYTQTNCELECFTNHTLNECGCVAFHMPRKNNTKICGPGKKQCVIEAEHELRMSWTSSSKQFGVMGKCNCLPCCVSINYNAELSQADLRFYDLMKAYESKPEVFKDYHGSRLTIFFKETYFTTILRTEIFGATDFLASFGGLLGFYFGGSILSLIELLYYTTLRPWYNYSFKRRQI